jgi:hypothetical protein
MLQLLILSTSSSPWPERRDLETAFRPSAI